MNLYNLVGNYKQAQEMLEDDSINIQVVIDTLESIETAIEVKAQNTLYIIKNLQAYSVGIKAEIERLEAKQKAVNNSVDGIKAYMFGQLELAGINEIKTTVATIKQKNNPPAVVIIDEKLVPAKYQTVIPASFTISKKDIAADLKANIDVPGCKLSQGKRWEIK